MEKRRLTIRVDTDEKCHLLWSNSFYPATVKNVSLSGAHLYFDSSVPDVHSAGICQVHLDGDRNYAKLALKFIGLN